MYMRVMSSDHCIKTMRRKRWHLSKSRGRQCLTWVVCVSEGKGLKLSWTLFGGCMIFALHVPNTTSPGTSQLVRQPAEMTYVCKTSNQSSVAHNPFLIRAKTCHVQRYHVSPINLVQIAAFSQAIMLKGRCS